MGHKWFPFRDPETVDLKDRDLLKQTAKMLDHVEAERASDAAKAERLSRVDHEKVRIILELSAELMAETGLALNVVVDRYSPLGPDVSATLSQYDGETRERRVLAEFKPRSEVSRAACRRG